MFDFLRTGMADIIVGRHNGNVEIYAMIQGDEPTNEFKPPIKKFSYVSNSNVMNFCMTDDPV